MGASGDVLEDMGASQPYQASPEPAAQHRAAAQLRRGGVREVTSEERVATGKPRRVRPYRAGPQAQPGSGHGNARL